MQKVNVGELINVLPRIKHWHGISRGRDAVHAININTDKRVVNWLEDHVFQHKHQIPSLIKKR